MCVVCPRTKRRFFEAIVWLWEDDEKQIMQNVQFSCSLQHCNQRNARLDARWPWRERISVCMCAGQFHRGAHADNKSRNRYQTVGAAARF